MKRVRLVPSTTGYSPVLDQMGDLDKSCSGLNIIPGRVFKNGANDMERKDWRHCLVAEAREYNDIFMYLPRKSNPYLIQRDILRGMLAQGATSAKSRGLFWSAMHRAKIRTQ